MTVENVPRRWDRWEHSAYKWENIAMRDLVYTDLPRGIEDTIRQVIQVPDCRGEAIERIERLDPQTLEVIWYDDVEDGSYTTVPKQVIKNTQRVLSQLWGSNWRVERKDDERRWDDDHPQRALIRRVEAQRFQYGNEDKAHYKLMLHGRPTGVSDDVTRWQELDQYARPEGFPTQAHDVRDVYVYESSTGTKHLVDGYFRRSMVTDAPETECGRQLDRDEVAEGSAVTHFASDVQRRGTSTGEDPHPEAVLGEDLCAACWRSYQDVEKWSDGTVRDRVPPSSNFSVLRTYDVPTEDDQ